MAELYTERTPNLYENSPLGSLVRRTSSRRVKGKPANLTLPQATPPRPTGSPVPAPHSPILHAQFRTSTSTSASFYDDGASMRTISWDARSATSPSTPSSSHTIHGRAHAHDSVASSSYDLESITNRYRDTWRSSDAPSVYDAPDTPDIPTVVVSVAPEVPEPESWQDQHELSVPSKGGRMPSRVNNINFSRPVQSAVADIRPSESEERKREVLMRNARHQQSPLYAPSQPRSQSPSFAQSHSPSQSPLPSPRLGPSPVASPVTPGFGSRPVSPSSLHDQRPIPSPSSFHEQHPPSSAAQSFPLQLPTPTVPGLAQRINSSQSVYSDYSFYELPSTPTSGALPSPTLPPHAPVSAHGAPPSGRPHTKSSASKTKEESPAVSNPQTPQDYLQLGIKHHLENRLAESAAAFEKSATLNGGCGIGMLMWGLAQRHGWGCKKDEATGFRWLRRAAEIAVTDLEKEKQGDMSAVRNELVLAIYEVGQSFFRGWGVQKDKDMAVQYYRVAARLGDPDAQQELAFCLLNGKGCKKDKKEAAKWYRAAVQQGVSDIGLAWIYKDKYQ